MALFKAVVWALIFLTKLRFPPGVSIAIVLKVVTFTPTNTLKVEYQANGGAHLESADIR